MNKLTSLLSTHEDWLLQRVLHYARLHGLYTAQAEMSWRYAIHGVTAALLSLLSGSTEGDDPGTAFIKEVVHTHSARGVTLDVLLGYFLYFRRGYLDLLNETEWTPEAYSQASELLQCFFDQSELAICAEWATLAPDTPVNEFRQTNRAKTVETHKFLTVFDGLPSPVILFDAQAQVDRMNQAATVAFADTQSLPRWLTDMVATFQHSGAMSTIIELAGAPSATDRYYQAHLKRCAQLDEQVSGVIVILSDFTEDVRVDRMLRESEEKFHALFNAMSEGFVLFEIIADTDGVPLDYRFLEVNATFEQYIDRPRDEIIGHLVAEIFPHSSPEWAQHFCEVVLTGAPKAFQMFAPSLDCVYEVICYCPQPGQLAMLCHDISAQQEMKAALQQSEERLKMALEAANDGIWDLHLPSGEAYLSPRYYTMLGYLPGEFPPHLQSWEALIHPEDLPQALDTLSQYAEKGTDAITCEFRMKTKAGDWCWILSRSKAVEWDAESRSVRIVGTHTDITERKEAEARIHYLAYYDELTALPNRILCNDRLAYILARQQRTEGKVALLLIDLDRFKEVNESLGHGIGDLLLREIAQRLLACVRESDTVARLGGDEFAVILPDLLHPHRDIEATVRRVLRDFKTPFLIDGHELNISASIGIAVAPDDGVTHDALMKNVEMAMYRAKAKGLGGYHYFSAEMSAALEERRCLERELRKGLEQNEFQLYFQPQVDFHHQAIFCVEALVRWHHPRLGLLLPGRFISLAEETGLIEALGEWVLNAACAQLRRWQDAGASELTVAVNLSAKQFEQPNLLQIVRRALRNNKVSPSCLELEITETMAMRDVERTNTVLRQLRDLGVKIAIDDFGTGHSSFSYLRHFPVNTLKIDQSFVQDLCEAHSNPAIINAIIGLGRALGLTTIAECVETREQLDMLLGQGCEKFQGYFFSEPLPADEIQRLLISPDALLNALV